MERDLGYLADILDAARLIGDFAEGISHEEFLHDEKTQSAVIHQFEIIGEAASRVSTPFVVDHRELPWREMVGMRNRLIHAYREVDLGILWKAIHASIPELIALIEPQLPPEED